MYSKYQLAIKYIKYFLSSSNGKGHGTHSPFVFDFITKVLNDSRTFYCYESIEMLRNKMLHDNTTIPIKDFGAGSRLHLSKERKVSAIAKSSLKPKKYSQLLFRMVDYYQPSTVIELGTSLGITSSYLASGNSNAKIITMEGSLEVAAIAKRNFEALQLNNISVIEGNFDDTLPGLLSKINTADFVFVDGNHRKEPTVNYFEQLLAHSTNNTILIFDDIHWSSEMEEAWDYIKQHTAVTLTIDLFFIGIVFLRSEQKEKQHFNIRF